MASSYNFNGLGMGLGNLSRLSNAKTRSISAGFKMEEYSYLHVLDEISSLKRFNLERERIVQTMQGFTVLILTL
jgi:hypothetical protein